MARPMNTPVAHEAQNRESCAVGDWVRDSMVPEWQGRDKVMSFRGQHELVPSRPFLFARMEVGTGRSRIRGWKRIE